MYLPKSDIYSSLKDLTYQDKAIYVSQTQPPVFNDLPAIIFKVADNTPIYDLDNNILSQDLEVQIDIWTEDSVTASNILSLVEETMRSNLYTMSYSNDVPNIGNLFHIVTRFTKSI